VAHLEATFLVLAKVDQAVQIILPMLAAHMVVLVVVLLPVEVAAAAV
jgi:poly-D-alanine transfer protein DltD